MRRLAAILALACAAASALAQESLDGVIRTWGHGSRTQDFIGALARSWENGFRKSHPGVRFETTLRGNLTAIGGLYTGAADIGLMDRAMLAIELDGFQQVFGYDPLEITIATGSLDVRNHAPALAIFVHKDNPLDRLTLAQADAIFGADRRRGLATIRSWGELGLTGEWAAKPIDPYGFATVSDEAYFFERAVLGGSHKWSGRFRELPEAKILDALARDRNGIAISTMAHKNPRVKAVALGESTNGPFHEATLATVAARQYPLTRTLSAFVNRAPGKPLDPKVREYLRYILGDEGQRDIASAGGYLPLKPEVAREESKKIP